MPSIHSFPPPQTPTTTPSPHSIHLVCLRECSWLGLGMIIIGLLVCCLCVVVIKTGFLGWASVVNALLTMYFNGGCVEDAYGVFEEAED